MPPPTGVTLVPPDPRWADVAREESGRICSAAGDGVVAIHHIGSTAIAGLCAKPVLDLLGVVESLTAIDAAAAGLRALGYLAHGEYGLVGRRYFTRTDAATGRRLAHLHCYAAGDPAIARHLAFRDFLRAHPDVAAEYAREKARCAALHRHDSHAYTECKSAWIRRVEAEALAWFQPAPG